MASWVGHALYTGCSIQRITLPQLCCTRLSQVLQNPLKLLEMREARRMWSYSSEWQLSAFSKQAHDCWERKLFTESVGINRDQARGPSAFLRCMTTEQLKIIKKRLVFTVTVRWQLKVSQKFFGSNGNFLKIIDRKKNALAIHLKWALNN